MTYQNLKKILENVEIVIKRTLPETYEIDPGDKTVKQIQQKLLDEATKRVKGFFKTQVSAPQTSMQEEKKFPGAAA